LFQTPHRKAALQDLTPRCGNPAALAGHEPGAVDADDSALWERSRAGDADAFTALFERHARTIYNYCFRRISDWSAAEDLLSIVFLEAWRNRRSSCRRARCSRGCTASRRTSSATVVAPSAGTARRWRACRPPPKGFSRLWLVLPSAAAIVAAAALLAWRRRWFVR
jgi:hypothetical protein